MAISNVTNCFSHFSVREFDVIEAAAQRVSEGKGRAQPINADYAEAVRGIIDAKQAKLRAITDAYGSRVLPSRIGAVAAETHLAVSQWQEGLRRAATNPQAKDPNMPTPAVLRLVGAKADRLTLPRAYLKAILEKHPDVPARVLENLPASLADPLFIIPYKDGGVRVFVQAQTARGEPVAVGVSVEPDGRINTVTPLHNHEGADGQLRMAQMVAGARGKIYAKNKEALEQARASAAAAPATIALHRDSVSGTTVITRDDVVKMIESGAGAKYSSADSSSTQTAFTVAQARAAIGERHGKILAGLESKRLVTLAQTEEEAITAAAQARADKTGGDVEAIKASLLGAAGVDIKRSADGKIQGFYDPATGMAFMIADNMTRTTAPGVLMHEVGIHMAADGAMQSVFDRALHLLKTGQGDALIDRVQARMDTAGETSGEEAAAYITEEYENDPSNAPGFVRHWIGSLYATIRAWMFRRGIIITADHLTPADIHAVARANAKALVQGGKVAGGARVALSRAAAAPSAEAADAARSARVRGALAAYTANPPKSMPPQALLKAVDALPEAWRPAAFKVAQVLTGKAGDAINKVAFTEDLIDRAKALGVQSADQYRRLLREQSAVLGGHEREVQRIAGLYMGIEEAHKGLGKNTANQYLHDSTMQRKWGYRPDFITDEAFAPDPEMEKAFNALAPKAQEYVKAVFAYGHETLEAKKKAVLDSVPSVFDALIASEGNADERQRLEDEKAATIKQFGSLYRLGGTSPYAPLKRFGKYVVSAKSAELAAMEQHFANLQDGAERKAVRKDIRKMQADSAHQFVDFVDNEYEARTIEERLRQSGKFGDVQTRERNEASLYSGSGTLNALRAIEAKLHNDTDGNHKRAMLKLVGTMYLTALSEDSARRSEMERIGVTADNADGTTRLDMQRAFESQGKADAFFLAHAATGRGLQAVFKKMQLESNAGGDTRAKSALYNELILRRIQSMNYADENWSHKLVRLASKYMLAFSPAYYLQNATQPWMVSLPIMAGRHDFTAAASTLARKYEQIAGAVKSADLLGNLDFDMVLSGVKDTNERAFLERALKEGIIDIGHGIDLAESSHYDSAAARGWAKVDRSIRNVQQKAEAINRITTALTAYELEFAKTKDVTAAADYAERIVRETHGDYSAWNAPRAFNTDLGRVALQFRKYQLIQLTLMGRLLKNTFASAATPEERMQRAAARKALGLMLGQAFLVGGAKALPMLAVVPALLSGAFGHGGDEPPEYLFRQWIKDKDLADVLLNGLPSKLTGLNLTKFGGMGNVTDILPFQNGLLPHDRSSMESFGYAILGGPLGGLTLRAADGASNIANGLWWKGIEGFVPTGFANASKSIRYGVQGDENRRGTLNLAKEEFSAFTLAAQAIGIQPGVAERRMYEQQTKYAIETAFKDQGNRLKAEYVRAMRDGDTASAAQARRQWVQMQSAQRSDGIQPSPLATLLQAPLEARRAAQQRKGTQTYTRRDAGLGARVAAF